MNQNLVTVERIHLWYYNSYENSDKVYNIELQQNLKTNLFSVYFEYGRRGKKLKPGYKVENVSRDHAVNVMMRLSNEKQKGRRSQYDLISHDRNMKTINIIPYVDLAKSLSNRGVLSAVQANRIIELLESGETETVIMATEILIAKQSKTAA